jgi:amino acid adenylation domain-containing protein
MQPNERNGTGLSEARRALLQQYLRGAKPATIPKREESGPAPLSYPQRQIWLHSQLAAGWLIYNEPITIYRYGPLDVSALERSFTEIVRRHEAWRTTFKWDGDECVQIVGPAPKCVKLPIVDLRAHPQAEAEARRLATTDMHQPFDLAEGPMYRLRLVRLRDDEHRLYITLHHIIFDGVSLYRVLLPELVKAYEAFSKNESPQLPDLPIQYCDYAAWQRKSIKEIPSQHLAYWQSTLADLPVLNLKTDHPHPPSQTYPGAMELFEVSGETSAALKALSREQRAAPFAVMAAAFTALLHGYTEQENIVIGGISSGRDRAETMNLLGCFLNTLPICCAFSKADRFVDLIARVRGTVLEALSHETPFELLVQRFAGKRDPSRAPLLQVLMVMEPPLDPLPTGWGFAYMDVKADTAKFDLQLGLEDRDRGLAGSFIYNTDLFEPQTIQLLKSRWLNLLHRIAGAPTQTVSKLIAAVWRDTSALPPIEWSGTRTDYPRDATIHQIFEQQVARTPAAVAIAFGDTKMTYRELNRRANCLARRLQKLRVGRDVPVGVFMERSPEMVVALLAILKAGGAYVPLDPSYPAERISLMIGDTETPVILTQSKIRSALVNSKWNPKILCADTETFPEQSKTSPQADVQASDIAYIMYTSGSTGTPKGVAVPHRAVVRLVKNTTYASFSTDETFLQLAPISFDASTFEIWGPLLNGGKLAVLPSAAPTLEEIGRAIAEHRVTTLWLTAGLFNAMVDERVEDLRPLRQLLTGGDVLSFPHVRRAIDALPNTRLINGYGPTESTTFACCHTIQTIEASERSVPIGKPINNTTVYIVDANLKPVPIGVPGELCIGGDGLARGYWRHNELTAEKFVADPFSRELNAQLYKTGDLARWRNDGVIEFLGRKDSQIKLRGFRVEPGEVEAALKRQADVRDAAVVACKDARGEKHLVAYVVGRASSEKLLVGLRKSLPDYMVPSVITILTALPRTANGKLDRFALPIPDLLDEPTAPVAAPRTSLEQKLAGTWASVLGLDRVNPFESFFDLGGHSLAGLRVVNQLSENLGQRLSPAIFIEAPTVAAMAELLEAKYPDAVARWVAEEKRGSIQSQRAEKHVRVAEYQKVRPYLSLQMELIASWEDLLGVRGIGIRDNFFELGGNPQLASRMFQRAEHLCGTAIDPSSKFSENPTIEALAAEIVHEVIDESASLLTIQEHGSRTPFFYLHGDLLGGGFYTLKLARALGTDQPLYVLPPHHIRDLPEMPTIEQMAAAHLEAIRTVRPRGPYIIGGFCLGAVVAYELAQQIAASGETVEMLVLIDAEPADKPLQLLRSVCETFARWFHWDDRLQLNRFRQWALLHTKFDWWWKSDVSKKIRSTVRKIRNRMFPQRPAINTAQDERIPVRDVATGFLWAATGYRPKPYPGLMSVLLSEDLLERGDHLDREWRRLAHQAAVFPLKGSHLECITAHVGSLAETIDRCLRTVVADRSSSGRYSSSSILEETSLRK